MKQRRVTMADIAAKVGISSVAVGMALRDHHRVSVERRREVKRVARELGFVPDPFLSALAAHRRQRVSAKDHGVLAWINHWQDPKQLRQFREFDLYWEGANAAAARFGYRLDEIRWAPDCPPKRLEKILLARGIEGVLIPPHHLMIDWEDFDWSKFSMVRFGLSVPRPDCNVVTADSFRAIVMALGKIHEYGYRRIGLTVNAEFNQRIGGNLLSGFFYAQKLFGLKPPLPPLLTVLKRRTAEELSRQKAALSAWLQKHRPAALLIADREIPGMICELGYRIPQDLAVAGTTVWDIPGVDTGIDQHSEAIGRIAAETLLKQMNVGERGEPRFPVRILIESRWQDGKTLPLADPAARTETTPAIQLVPPVPDPGSQRITLKDIADKVGVSKTAVSRALRGAPDVSLEMRTKIRQVARDLGYGADPILQRLAEYRRSGVTGKFQSVIAWLSHWDRPEQLRRYHEFEQYWRGARLAAKRLGYRLLEFLWPADCSARRAEQMLREREVLGLLIPPHKEEVIWGDFDWSKFSLMRFGLTMRQVDANLVTSDHLRAIAMAITKLHGSGYRRIGLIYNAAHDRLMGGNYYGGFVWAGKALGMEQPIPPLGFSDQYSPADNLQVLKTWMQSNQPDAVLTTAAQVPSALRQLGFRVPRDVAVAGTSLHDIPVTPAIDQRPHAIGQIAAEMLIKQISLNERGEPGAPCRILVESRWHDRTFPRRRFGGK